VTGAIPHGAGGGGEAGAGAALGKNDRAVLDVLRGARSGLGAYDILDALRPAGLKAPLQVYRALNRLMARGLVHKIESLNAYVACARPGDACAAALAICRACGTVSEFTDAEIDRRLTGWCRETAFTPEQVTLEIRGLCADCAVEA